MPSDNLNLTEHEAFKLKLLWWRRRVLPPGLSAVRFEFQRHRLATPVGNTPRAEVSHDRNAAIECTPERHRSSLVAQAGRAPFHGGSDAHSDALIRRSSLPTLTKTNGASWSPVLDPTNIAGLPYASRIIAVLDILSPGFVGRLFLTSRRRPVIAKRKARSANHRR